MKTKIHLILKSMNHDNRNVEQPNTLNTDMINLEKLFNRSAVLV